MGIAVNPEQSRNVLLKLVTAVLYLNKSMGIAVNPEQASNAYTKFVTAVLYLNRSVGIAVNPEQPQKVHPKFVIPGQLSKRPTGSDVIPVQFLNIFSADFNTSPEILYTLVSRVFESVESKSMAVAYPDILAVCTPAEAYVWVFAPTV